MTKHNNLFPDIQAIAFDLDGTLVNSVPGLTQTMQLTLHDLNLPSVTEAQMTHWIGNGVEKLIERALSHLKAPMTLKPQTLTLFNKHYNHTINTGSVLFPGVQDTLQSLQKNDYLMALVTNKPARFLPDLLRSLRIDHYFSLCLGDGDVIKLKPHPASLYKVMATFGIFHDQLLFVGDSRNDISAAKNANCPTIGLSYGYNYGESIAHNKPDVICDHFADILSYVSLPKARAKK